MRKKKFFNNLGNVAIFGLCVTLVCFVIYSVLSVMIANLSPTIYNYKNGVDSSL